MCHRKVGIKITCISVVLVIIITFGVCIVAQHKNKDSMNPTEIQANITDIQVETIDLDDFTSGIQLGTFDLNEYKTYVNQFHIDYCVEAIDSTQTAAKSAIRIWEKEYGYIAGNYLQPQVFYDSTADCWLVMGSPPKWEGEEGVAFVYYIPIVIIQADGTVLALWLS